MKKGPIKISNFIEDEKEKMRRYHCEHNKNLSEE